MYGETARSMDRAASLQLEATGTQAPAEETHVVMDAAGTSASENAATFASLEIMKIRT